MPKPYAHLRAQMAPDAQRQAERRAQARVEAEACAYAAYAVWYRHTYPTAPHLAACAWQMLATHVGGRAIRGMWDAIATAVLGNADESP